MQCDDMHGLEVAHLSPMSRHSERSRVVSVWPRPLRRIAKAVDVTPEQLESSRLVSCGPTRARARKILSWLRSMFLPDSFKDFIHLSQLYNGGDNDGEWEISIHMKRLVYPRFPVDFIRVVQKRRTLCGFGSLYEELLAPRTCCLNFQIYIYIYILALYVQR